MKEKTKGQSLDLCVSSGLLCLYINVWLHWMLDRLLLSEDNFNNWANRLDTVQARQERAGAWTSGQKITNEEKNIILRTMVNSRARKKKKKKKGEMSSFHFKHIVDDHQPDFKRIHIHKTDRRKKIAYLFIACPIFPWNILLALVFFLFTLAIIFHYFDFFLNSTLFSVRNWDCNFLNL